MKNTPAVFLTSLAVSAISLTVPMPAATTVLDLFIGEDITAQHINPRNCESHQHKVLGTDDTAEKPVHTISDWETLKLLRRLPSEQERTVQSDSEAAFTRIRNSTIHYAKSKRT
ncbi:hypothetical protein ACFS7Z_15195 [Pontibacter toksunensis]|uniref:Uncharacterized protein n=1 Tax=Pontibacter toksunensis TaxID=1332631 RepID=A0ABW6BXQ9_9BACT